MCSHDALDDGEPETDAAMIAADALRAALEWLGECLDQLWTDHVTGVLDSEQRRFALSAGRDPDGPASGHVVDYAHLKLARPTRPNAASIPSAAIPPIDP